MSIVQANKSSSAETVSWVQMQKTGSCELANNRSKTINTVTRQLFATTCDVDNTP